MELRRAELAGAPARRAEPSRPIRSVRGLTFRHPRARRTPSGSVHRRPRSLRHPAPRPPCRQLRAHPRSRQQGAAVRLQDLPPVRPGSPAHLPHDRPPAPHHRRHRQRDPQHRHAAAGLPAIPHLRAPPRTRRDPVRADPPRSFPRPRQGGRLFRPGPGTPPARRIRGPTPQRQDSPDPPRQCGRRLTPHPATAPSAGPAPGSILISARHP